MKNTLLFVSILCLFSCQEESSQSTPHLKNLTLSTIDTIYYRTPGQDFFELPLCNGHYDCSLLDINVDCEQRKLFAANCSGIVFTLKCINGNDTSTVVALISGVHYPDGEYFFNTKKKITPYYNGIIQNAPAGSIFDTPPMGISTASSQGVVINQNTGEINLHKTITNIFLNRTEQIGTKQTFRIYYKLNDASYYTLNYTDITFVYDPLTSARTSASGPGCATIVVAK